MKKMTLFFVVSLFILSPVFSLECGTEPSDGCEVTVPTTFSVGNYNLNKGIIVDGTDLDCNGANLFGSNGVGGNESCPSLGIWLKNGATATNCNVYNYKLSESAVCAGSNSAGFYVDGNGGEITNSKADNNGFNLFVWDHTQNIIVNNNTFGSNATWNSVIHLGDGGSFTNNIVYGSSAFFFTNKLYANNLFYGSADFSGWDVGTGVEDSVFTNNELFSTFYLSSYTDNVNVTNNIFHGVVTEDGATNVFWCINNVGNTYSGGSYVGPDVFSGTCFTEQVTKRKSGGNAFIIQQNLQKEAQTEQKVNPITEFILTLRNAILNIFGIKT